MSCADQEKLSAHSSLGKALLLFLFWIVFESVLLVLLSVAFTKSVLIVPVGTIYQLHHSTRDGILESSK